MFRYRVLFAAALLAGAGCSATDGEAMLVTFEPSDAPLADSFWAETEAVTDETARRTSVWLLPFYLDHNQVELEEGRDRVRYISISGLNPGLTLLPTLPFWVDVDYGRWTQNGDVERRGFTWTPLWMWDSAQGESEVKLDAVGFPLLWGNVEVDAAEDGIYLNLHHFILSLGPLWTDLKMGRDGRDNEGWIFHPVYAAGLGGLLWSSYSFEGAGGSETAHGPLNGWLGYSHSVGRSSDIFEGLIGVQQDEVEGFLSKRDDPEEDTASNPLIPSKTLVLGGILWSDFTESDSRGEVLNSRKGPLWGMFGYGKKNGDPTINLLWIPIRI